MTLSRFAALLPGARYRLLPAPWVFGERGFSALAETRNRWTFERLEGEAAVFRLGGTQLRATLRPRDVAAIARGSVMLQVQLRIDEGRVLRGALRAGFWRA